VPLPHTHALFGPRFLRHLWRLVRIYWTSPDARRGGLLLATAIALELATVYGTWKLSEVQRDLFDAFQDKQMAAFLAAIGFFLTVAAGFVTVSTLRIYLRGALEIRWRRWMTAHFLEQWMTSQAYCEIELHRKGTDNPDQRISEDIRDFVASALGLSLSLLAAIVTLVTFSSMLWSLSGTWTFSAGANHFHIPGLMMWVAIAYGLLAIFVTHRVGRSLIGIQFNRQRVEADFRFTLARFRENVEDVALAQGEPAERRTAVSRFDAVVDNYWSLIRKLRDLTLLTTGIGQANSLVPLLVAAPAFFAGHLSFGSVMQVRIAYGEVSGGLTWFVNAYQEIARWRANIERLVTLLEEIEATTAVLDQAERVQIERAPDGWLRLDRLRLSRPDGTLIVEDASATLRHGNRVALYGPSGAGKRMLLRAIAGIWRFGSGRIEIPIGSRTLFLPQRPYLPIGSLREALTYPEPATGADDVRAREVLELVGLGPLANRLDDREHWQQFLSGGEQQLLGIARALLQEPDWLFLDEATSGLDEPTERRVYHLLAERLPRTGLVSIADRPTVASFHDRQWRLARGDSGTLLEAA
jgi:putative ATP-binding cassette transporter